MRRQYLRPVFLLLLACGWLLFTLSQTISPDAAELLREYKKADSYYRQATSLADSKDYTEEKEESLNRLALEGFRKLDSIPQLGDSLRFFTVFKIGELEHYFENHAAALGHYRQAIALQKKAALPDSLLFKPLLYSGLIYYNQSLFDSAIGIFQQAEKIQAKYNNRLAEKERLYNVFGVLYYETGNYVQAKNYIEKALELLPLRHPYFKDLYINYQINLGQINLKLEDYDRANSIYQQILPLNINKAEILHNIGLINLYLGSAKKALGYFRQVKFNNQKDIRLYTNMGTAFLNLDQQDSAYAYFQKALQVKVPVNNVTSISLGSAFKGLGDLYAQQGDHLAAVRNYQRSIWHFYPAFTDTSIQRNPEKFSGIFSYINLFHAITAKAASFHALYQKTKETGWAVAELDAYQSAFELVDYVERIYDSDEARLFLNKIKYLVHNNPIEAAYGLYKTTGEKEYLEQLYYFDQKNKASVLSFNQQRNMANIGSRQLRSLKREITRLSIKASNTNDSAELHDINAVIRDKEIELGKLYDEAGRTMEWTERVPAIRELQKKLLDEKTAILSYHLADSALYCVEITKETFEVNRKTIGRDFSDALQEHITTLHEPQPEKAGEVNWHELLIPGLDEEITRLIIVPDDELSYLSFESLQGDQGLLASRYSVQYQYATSLLREEKFGYEKLAQVSFAPFSSFKNERFDQLKASEEEIRDLPGKKYVGASATKQQFLQSLPEAGILHLATHASASDTSEGSAFIAFYPDSDDHLLLASEIYSLDLDSTKLVILSACETGTGELERGEGVMSLSRAFAYAGCQNVITSLWKADDASTSYLLRRVHDHLLEGESIDQALSLARKDYLGDPAINPRRKAPAYWAHLVFIGNYEPERKLNILPWIIAAFALIALTAFIIKKAPGKVGAGGFR